MRSLVHSGITSVLCALKNCTPVVPGRAGGGSFRGKRVYRVYKPKPRKKFAYRMCARSPTSAMPKPTFCVHQPSAVLFGGGVWWWLVVFSWCVGGGAVMRCDVMWYDVMWLAAR